MITQWLQPVRDAIFDPKTREPTPVAWGLVGLILAVVGLVIFAMDFWAILKGQQTVLVSSRGRAAKYMPADLRALIMLTVGICGLATLWRALTLRVPAFCERNWVRGMARFIMAPLALVWLALAAFALLVRTGMLG
ncbi:MAG: hypothetical protein JNK75_10365 [Betaproteobacteria bacterium]|nr:hypothetical protein [Betaproteobacteria bacterium]